MIYSRFPVPGRDSGDKKEVWSQTCSNRTIKTGSKEGTAKDGQKAENNISDVKKSGEKVKNIVEKKTENENSTKPKMFVIPPEKLFTQGYESEPEKADTQAQEPDFYVEYPEKTRADEFAYNKHNKPNGQIGQNGLYEQYEQTAHGPEIAVTEPLGTNDASKYGSRLWNGNGRARIVPPIGAVVFFCCVCLASFVLGCSVTDKDLCRMVIAISTVATGKAPDIGAESPNYTPGYLSSDSSQTQTESNTNGDTVYQKYMLPDEQGDILDTVDDDTLTYLSNASDTEDNTGDGQSQDNSQADSLSQAQPVGAEQEQSGKIGSDGEVLYPVLERDISSLDLGNLSNETSYNPDTSALLQSVPAALENLSINPSEPLVLIVHTHGTESYNECLTEGYYNPSLPVRSEDLSKNVVGVGQEFAEVLNSFGIPTVHSTEMCDKDSFIRAYSTSSALVKQYLEQYPSIRFVIDLHRDSIASADGTKTKPVFSYLGQKTAQLMFVVGTDAAGAVHPSWQDNLSLALLLQSRMSGDVPELFRRINLRSASFNQQLSSGYMLLECGSCANSLDEAQRAARLFATEFAKILKSYDKQ